MKNKNNTNDNATKINRTPIYIICMLFIISLSAAQVSSEPGIYLNGTGEVLINDSNSLDGFSKATWNMWIKQEAYNSNSGVVGKYEASAMGRSYLIRNSLSNGSSVSVAISGDGTNTGLYTSNSILACGIRENNQWTMITVTYDGSLIKYYRNGVFCDQDKTIIPSIYNSISPLRLGGGNNIFFNGGIDEFTFYDQSLSREQITRLHDESFHGNNLGQSIPVLVYHKIENSANDAIVVSPDQFQAQMDYLYKNEFNTITLQNYVDWKNGNYDMPKKAIIIVFDDGFLSVYDTAKPIMDKYGFKGSVPVVTRYASFTGNSSGYMKWDQINDLANNGWSIESHSITHSHLLTLNESQFRYELSYSKELLTNKTGNVPNSFVFPFHESNANYTSICGEYYDLCWTQGSLNPTYDFKSTPGTEYLSLRRINIVNITTLEYFANYLRRDTNKFGEWNMEEGAGNTTIDSSGNDNTGYLLGGASWYSKNLNSTLSSIFDKFKTLSDDNKIEDGLDNIIDSDKGKAPIKLEKEKTWPDNMDIEGYYYSIHDPIKLEKEDKDKENKGKIYTKI